MTKHDHTRNVLGSWQLWMGVAYFGLVAVVFALYVQSARLNTESTRRAAQTEAVAEAAFEQCTQSVPELARVDAFLAGVQGLGDSLLENSIAAHQAGPAETELYRIQAENIGRLRRSVKLISGLRFPIPTPAECAARRTKARAGG